jgi:hypothetical protein
MSATVEIVPVGSEHTVSVSVDDVNLQYAKKKKKDEAKVVLVTRAKGVEVTPDTIITVLQYAIDAVSIATVPEIERREIVIELVREAIVDAPISDEREKLMLDMVDNGIVGHIIDMAVSASDGKLHTGAACGMISVVTPHVVKAALRCISSCFRRKRTTG